MDDGRGLMKSISGQTLILVEKDVSSFVFLDKYF